MDRSLPACGASGMEIFRADTNRGADTNKDNRLLDDAMIGAKKSCALLR